MGHNHDISPDNYTDNRNYTFPDTVIFNVSFDDTYDYSYDHFLPSSGSCDALCLCILVLCIITSILGVLGNGLVIGILVLRTKRSVNSSWYFSLAVSDLLLCVTLPFNCAYWIAGEWHFGDVMCKFINLAMPLNMYSSIFLLVVISVDRCMCVMLPVWSQNHRTLGGSSVVIVTAWILSSALSVHNLVFYSTDIRYDVHDRMDVIVCGQYGTDAQKQTIVAVGFIFGLALPLVVIVICYAIIMRKLRVNRMTRSPKPFRVMTAVIITFVISWLPYQIFRMLAANQVPNIERGIVMSTILAYANSLMNPVLYSLMGQDFRHGCCICSGSLCARMENALQQEDQATKTGPISTSADQTNSV
ncbi:formyl peptide receptor-related sequence 4-like [Engraulis encrasicolus]|uniref:formyl peptide receptor-related sequence 4-like n=1 Tax=Engraulis encrasicolus TaxID=184585 RepID=UPI002FCF1C3F